EFLSLYTIRMQSDVAAFGYLRSSVQAPCEYKDAYHWGAFTRYLEITADGFASRQVDEYANGYLSRYDRVHWDDQFGTLASLRFGEAWLRHWGQPTVITRSEFEQKWHEAANSVVSWLKLPSPSGPPPWL